MGTRKRFGIKAAVFLLFLTSLVLVGIRVVSAAGKTPPGPDRFAVIVQKYISYTWWLTSWDSNTVICSLAIDHKGLPTGGEIYDNCGQDIYDEWILTSPCPQIDGCGGFYLQLIKSVPAQRKVGVKRSPPMVWVTLNGCTPYKSTFRCESLPTLVLSGEEPLEGEHITRLAGNVDGKPFNCDPVCQVDLTPTDENGLSLEFWAYSSYGDSSEIFKARVRVAQSADATDKAWYVDVLSTQWRGEKQAGCSETWDKFPPVGGNPAWLSTPQRSTDLNTQISYEYLATNLIKNGMVDASACAGGGLLDDGTVNACGLAAARPAVYEWQNRFDELIFSASQKTGVPAVLLKNIFARESQFWPVKIAGHPEVGLGQMTDGGADAVLTWNPSFYEQFCPTVLDQSVCKAKIYPLPEEGWEGIGLDEFERTMLRSALVKSVDAVCPACDMGIDLKKVDYSVGVFAETLVANCEQAAMVVELNYGGTAAEAASYEDLWRFTLVNYNAGPGCLGLAIDETSNQGDPLDWEHLSSNLTPACQGAISYVNEIGGQGSISISAPPVIPTPQP